MKKAMLIVTMLIAVILNCCVGGLLASTVSISPIWGAVGLNAVAAVLGAGNFMPAGALRAGLYTEVWTGYMVKAMRTAAESLGWYNLIKSFDQYAENDVIHLVHIGVDPTVLINNTTYPIEIESLEDTDKPIALDKYQTKPTAITDDEVHALSYDKMSSVIERHREALDNAKYTKALHSLAPSTNSSVTPVILTTGENDESNTRRTITRKDIIRLKKAFDVQKVPVTGRVLVLCPDHVNDLLASDQKFADQYYNYITGKISNMYSFQIFEYQDCPYFNNSTLAKIAWGSSVSGHFQGSVAFYAPRMMKANGSTKTYMSKAENDPQNQQNLVNFRTYSICMPMKLEAIGAIVSAPAIDLTITTNESVTLPSEGGTESNVVSTNGGDWTVQNDDPADTWLVVAKVGDQVSIVTTDNSGVESRVGSYTISLTSNPTVTKTVTVTQNYGYITTGDSVAVAAAGGTNTRTVKATGDWTVVNDNPTEDSWMTISKSGDKVSVVTTANAGAERTGSYTITLTDNPTVTKTVTVTQATGL